MDIGTIGIVGAGQMGSGIAQVAAQAGFDLLLNDISEAVITRGLANLTASLDRVVARGKMEREQRDNILSRIKPALSFDDFRRADFIIEAATENAPLKIEIFKQLNAACRPEVILASNTSSISITRLGTASGRPDKVIGMHFMNPPPVMRLVEIVRGLATAPETYECAKSLAERMGKATMVAEDSPGFVVNRVLLPMINEAIYAIYEGIGAVEDVDMAMKLGTNQPMGPLELADLIGLDTCLAIMEVMQDVLGDDKYRPCPLLKKYVDAGYLGRKSGRGFYRYDVKPAEKQKA
jgi:3-hydroxybutyryl-CoA dehydrogenase